jgi:hypothetical protein
MYNLVYILLRLVEECDARTKQVETRKQLKGEHVVTHQHRRHLDQPSVRSAYVPSPFQPTWMERGAIKPTFCLDFNASINQSFDAGNSENTEPKSSLSSDSLGHKVSFSTESGSLSVSNPTKLLRTSCAAAQSSNRRVACVNLGDLVKSVMRTMLGRGESPIGFDKARY